MGNPHRDEDTLRRLYVDEGMTMSEIADKLDCTTTTVWKWMGRHGIEARDPSEAKLVRRDEAPYRDPETLERLYHGESMTVREIAEKFDVAKMTISRWLRKHDIDTRTPNESCNIRGTQAGPTKDGPHTNPEWLGEKYHDEGLTAQEMADEAGVESEVTILRQMEKHDIERRTPGDYLRKENKVRVSDDSGHEQIRFTVDDTSYYYDVHRLLAIALWGLDEVAGKVIHHENGIPWDNRPENLELVESQATHAKMHNEERDRDEYGRYT